MMSTPHALTCCFIAVAAVVYFKIRLMDAAFRYHAFAITRQAPFYEWRMLLCCLYAVARYHHVNDVTP